MHRFGLLYVTAVSACMSMGGCGWKYHMVEATVTDHKRGIPAAGATVYVDYPFTLPWTPAQVRGVTDADGRIKLVLADCGAQLHVCSIGDQSTLVMRGYKPRLWKQYIAGTRFEAEGTIVREGGRLLYKPDLNQDQPLAKHVVTLTPAPPTSSLGRLMLRLGIIPMPSSPSERETGTPDPLDGVATTND